MEHTFMRNVKTEKTDLQVSGCKTGIVQLPEQLYVVTCACLNVFSESLTDLNKRLRKLGV